MKKLLAILLTSFAASAGNASTTILCKYEDGSHVEDGVLQSYPTKGSFTLSFNEDFVVKTNRRCPKEIENVVTEDAIVLRCMRGEIEASLLIRRTDGTFSETNGIFLNWGSCKKKLNEF